MALALFDTKRICVDSRPVGDPTVTSDRRLPADHHRAQIELNPRCQVRGSKDAVVAQP